MEIESIWNELRNRGLRMTSLKKHVVRLFLEGGCGLSAREILDSIPSSPHISTVHRCLCSLEDAGFLRPDRNPDGLLRYRCSRMFYPDHGHFSCQECGKRIPFSFNLPEEFLQELERTGGFKIGNADFFLEGKCEHCSKES